MSLSANARSTGLPCPQTSGLPRFSTHGRAQMHDDLKELIVKLQSHDVEFLVVGAHTRAFHGRPRFTEDLDLFLRRSPENEVALISALQ